MKDTIQTITAIPNVSPLDFEKETTPKKKPPATKKKSRKSTKTPKTKQPKLNQLKSTNLSEIKIQPEPESESTRKSRESLSVIPVEPKPLTEAQTQPPSTKRKKLPRLSKKKSTQNSDPIQPPVDSSEPAQEIKTSPQITKKEEQIITIAEVPQAKKREVTKSLRKKMEKKSTNKRKTRTSKQTKELKTENNCRKARKKRSKKSRAGNSDSSEEDCFTDQFVFELNDEFDFVCLTEADIIAEQTREIMEVSEILSISESATITLLKHFKWNRDKLMTEYFDNPSRVLESAGVGEDSISPVSIATPKGSEKIKAKTDEKIECTICSMDVLPSEMYSLETCGHSFCDCCWESYLTIQIKEGQAFVNCAQLGCSALVPENDVKKLVEPAVFQKYCTFFMQSFVDNNDNVKWCPAPGCGNAVTSDMISDKTVTCACSYRFCFQCSEEAHQPASCAQVKLWRKKCADESETNNWIIANTQECPKCSLPTEKNGGCNHMTCRQCKHEYCWICYKDWKGHNDYYNCNRYQKSKDDKKSSKKNSRKERELQRLEMRKALEKYLHYHSRFMNHSKSSELEATSEKAMKQMHQMRETEATDAEVIFIEQATKQLSIARSVLKYSYVRRYYMDDEDNSTALFEFFQEDLEKTAEELSENLANPMANKFHIVNLTTLIETHIHNMIAAVDTNQN